MHGCHSHLLGNGPVILSDAMILVSMILVVVYTIYYCLYARTKKQYVRLVSGKCISMSIGMVTSTTIGLVFALFFPGDLAYSTVFSVVVSFILAYFIGSIFGVSGIIEAIAASFMGALMGAMLGEMIPETRVSFILIFMDIIYLGTVMSFMLIMNEEARRVNQMLKGKKTVTLFLPLIFSLFVIGLTAALENSKRDIEKDVEMEHMDHH